MKLPDGPTTPRYLRILRTLQWIFQPLDVLEERAQRYGDTFALGKNTSTPLVYVSNPEAIRQILTADPEMFESGRANKPLQFLLGENSLILLDGKKHQRQRRLLMPPFHGERMRAYGKLICDITEQVMSQWKIGEAFYVRSAMQEISLRVILSAVFGLDKGQRFDQLRQLLSSLLDVIGSPLTSSFLFFPSLQKDLGSWSPWGRFLRQKQQINQLLYDEIQQRREQADPCGDDILSLLLSARDEAGQPMTDEELRDELLTLLFAGHETTASALSWALYWTDHLPAVRDRLLSELDTLSPDTDPTTIARLPYLSAVCQETLRIYPIAINPFPRTLKAPMEIMGYQFEPGTNLLISIYLTHHREDIYPEPKRFKPERFLERQFSPYEYLPFGGGNRLCIGMAFAQYEMKLVLATILSRYNLMLADSRPIKPARRGFTIAPPGNMRMVVNQRQRKNTLVSL
ncbi:MAG: cytochrome P450 [Symplocastrum torsivum CPER-KK1]|jgi:cytochrome P450|uniref:Cytochrome P450 n=1 Tax=Symplocastrum torsivum CPER-KK1 TaxID=450513 RepID=A0A951PQQ2_9CYAN|nr:cytochrome P450 [Symplocastrum torsivum CPER-KK1]